MKKPTILTLIMAIAMTAFGQYSETGQNNNYISTGMPILLIAPDATSSAMGDAGVASTPDAYSAHWNNAKFAFIDGTMGLSTTYTPWLRNLKVGDMNLLYLGGYYRINSRSTAAASLTYFTLGDMDHTDAEGNKLQTIHPNEFAFDVTYALKLTDNLALGDVFRNIEAGTCHIEITPALPCIYLKEFELSVTGVIFDIEVGEPDIVHRLQKILHPLHQFLVGLRYDERMVSESVRSMLFEKHMSETHHLNFAVMIRI